MIGDGRIFSNETYFFLPKAPFFRVTWSGGDQEKNCYGVIYYDDVLSTIFITDELL